MTTMSSDKPNYLNETRGYLSWVFTLDHKRVAFMYLISILVMFCIGGLFAMMAMIEASGADKTVMSHEAFGRTFSRHGVIMMFAVVVPSIPATLGYFLLPLMFGVRNMVFPRFTILSYHLWVVGVWFISMSAFDGGFDTGWTFSLPFSTLEVREGLVWVACGLLAIGLSTILTSVNFIATIKMSKPVEAHWTRLPILVWALKITAWIQLVAVPIACFAFIILIAERTGRSGHLNLNVEGDALLFERLFWLGIHPAIFVMVVPAIGLISDLISVHSRKRLAGYTAVTASMAMIGVLGFLSWGTHLFTAVQSPVINAVGSFFALSLIIPGTIIAFCWLATLYRASTQLNTPMLCAIMAIVNLAVGSLAGLFLANPATGAFLNNTYFNTAQMHYLLLGGVLLAMFAGVLHWWNKIVGREYSQGGVSGMMWVTFFGFHLTFFPMFILGSHGLLSRRYENEYASFSSGSLMHTLSIFGLLVLLFGFITIVSILVYSMMRGKPVESDNPFDAMGAEWQLPSPPPYENYTVPPVIGR